MWRIKRWRKEIGLRLEDLAAWFLGPEAQLALEKRRYEAGLALWMAHIDAHAEAYEKYTSDEHDAHSRLHSELLSDDGEAVRNAAIRSGKGA